MFIFYFIVNYFIIHFICYNFTIIVKLHKNNDL